MSKGGQGLAVTLVIEWTGREGASAQAWEWKGRVTARASPCQGLDDGEKVGPQGRRSRRYSGPAGGRSEWLGKDQAGSVYI